MEPIKRRVEHLTLWSFSPAKTSVAGAVLILGNAYGIMPYQVPLAKALADRGLEPWWFAFSGQEGTEGAFSLDSGVRDVTVIVGHLMTLRPGRPLWVIAHCAGGLIALEYLKRNPDAPVQKLIIYGLLFHPARRREHALPKLKEYGVKLALTEDDWNYNPLPALASVRIPILFCHPKDRLNLSRATEEEMRLAVGTARQAEIVWFAQGYDANLEPLSDFVKCYYSWLTTSKVPLREGGES